ncbi:GNAT family N-acetyltransferase [Piscinibacter koreensis]|uniref:N-acetyltransferase n=1 Tax=Piscinibacter koreensis TaxID=2742824 RepID=A0A7Y6TWK6_9BURK|nr:GNAT family N-acetyltransferase [Schlegelella koreensis]NUZ06153.1 N-acetyltransferase [Schlegelella koreensis]
MKNASQRRPAAASADEGVTVEVEDDLTAIDAAEWDALVERQPSANPFVRHAYLLALDRSRSAIEDTGWAPHYLLVRRAGRLVGACPVYLKGHSYGEYVFDWAWADAYRRHGLTYYPKLLGAVPFTPVPGPRLLAADDAVRRALVLALEQLAAGNELSSAHLLFVDAADQAVLRERGWLMRRTVQFHWHNRSPEPYADFAEFLAHLQRDKRKKIQQERRRVADAGIEFEQRQGSAITPADWDFFYRCYTLTYRAHHSAPYLTRDFFARAAAALPENWLMFIARRDGEAIAASLVVIDPVRKTAFGRYWGTLAPVNCLHFEACYYRPLAWCIANGFERFEGGAQGEHKMARGLLPVETWSAHWLAHPQFADAIGNYLAREGAGIDDYLDELNERRPFRAETSS